MPLAALFFFFNDTATTEIYTLSLHDALPISVRVAEDDVHVVLDLDDGAKADPLGRLEDRKSTRLNSSHGYISYAVFCLKKKKTILYARSRADHCAFPGTQSPHPSFIRDACES